MAFPALGIIVFTPIVAAIIILIIPAQRKTEVRAVALAAAAFDLLISLWVYIQYLTSAHDGVSIR